MIIIVTVGRQHRQSIKLPISTFDKHQMRNFCHRPDNNSFFKRVCFVIDSCYSMMPYSLSPFCLSFCLSVFLSLSVSLSLSLSISLPLSLSQSVSLNYPYLINVNILATPLAKLWPISISRPQTIIQLSHRPFGLA